MSGLPTLPKGQQYILTCCACGSKALVRGTTMLREAEDTWDGSSESVQEYVCDRQTCGKVSFLVIRVSKDGASLQWRNFKDAPRTTLS